MLKEYSWESQELAQVWKRLYRDNKYLTPYSSWEYNDIVHKYKKIKPQTIFQKDYFYVYYENENPLMIFPLSKKRGNLILFGENISGAEYLDFIYDENITAVQMIQALKELKTYHENIKLKLYKINERSKTYQYFHDDLPGLGNEFSLKEEMDRICKKIEFPNDYDEYFQNLSKHARQNLRTAYNKFKNNGMTVELKVFEGQLRNRMRLKEIFKVNTKRSEEWMHKQRPSNFAKYLKNRFFSVLSWSMQELEKHITFCLFLDGNLAAFMTGFVTNYNEVTSPMISMDSRYAKLSPGRIMISESIKYLQQHMTVRVLDVSRGDEQYKKDLGGLSHFNYKYELNL